MSIDPKSAIIGAVVAALFLNYAFKLGIGGDMLQWSGPRSQGGFL